MAERIYLQEWFYNAGIVGLLRLLGGEAVDGEKLLNRDGLPIEGVRIGENYIEVERELFKDFARKYYLEAAKREVENSGIDELKVKEDAKALKALKDRINQLIKKLFPYLQDQVKLPSRIGQKNLQEAKELLKKALIRLREEKEKLVRGELPLEFFEPAGKAWLRNFVPSQGGGNKISDGYEVVKQRIEEKLLLPDSVFFEFNSRKVPCTLCQERLSVKDLTFGKSISDLVGFNQYNINFLHFTSLTLIKSNKGLPICPVCQTVVALLPLGVVRFNTSFLFANTTSSVRELFGDNQRLKGLLSSSSPFLEFFAQKVLEKEVQSASFISLLGTSIIEMELGSSTPKVKALNLSYSLAELLTKRSFREKLEKLTKAYYKIKDKKGKTKNINLLVEFLKRLIEGKRDYSYLFKLFRYYLIKDREKTSLIVGYYPIHLYYLNLCLYEAKVNLGGKMAEVKLSDFYKEGQKLKSIFEDRGAENKINSLSFKLLNALKVGDTHRFMDILLRIYAGLSQKVPESFIKTLEDREAFKSAGYSFVAGLLNENNGGEDGKR